MVLKRVLCFIYNFFSPIGHSTVKEAPSFYEVIESEVGKIVEEGNGKVESSLSSEGELCCVCLSRLVEGEDMRTLPCLHEFHKACVDKWLSAWRMTWPLCRFPVGGDKSHTAEMLPEEMVTYFSSFHVAGF